MPPDAPAPAAPAAPAKAAPVVAPQASPPSPPGGTAAPPSPESAPAKAKDHAAVARAAHALREEKRALKVREESWSKEREELSGKVAALSAMAKELEVAKAERAEFLKDPIAWAEKHGGADATKAIQSYVDRTTPEKNVEAARAEAAEAKKAAAELKALLEQRDKASQEAEEKRAAAQVEANRNAACSAFVSTVTADPKKYPHMNFMYEKAEILEKTKAFQKAAEEAKEAHSFEEVANAFEADAKRQYEMREQRRAALLAIAEGDEAESASAKQVKPVPGSGRREAPIRPETRATPKEKPKRVLTRREQAAADIALLRDAAKRDATSTKAH